MRASCPSGADLWPGRLGLWAYCGGALGRLGEQERLICDWQARSATARQHEDHVMENSVYQARWLLGPLFVFCFAFVGVGLMAG